MEEENINTCVYNENSKAEYKYHTHAYSHAHKHWAAACRLIKTKGFQSGQTLQLTSGQQAACSRTTGSKTPSAHWDLIQGQLKRLHQMIWEDWLGQRGWAGQRSSVWEHLRNLRKCPQTKVQNIIKFHMYHFSVIYFIVVCIQLFFIFTMIWKYSKKKVLFSC